MIRRLGVVAACLLAGCGGGGEALQARVTPTPTATPTPTPAPTVTIEQIERQNAKARRAKRTSARAVAPPHITKAFIPFPASRKREMAAYARRHYGTSTYRLVQPRVIVEHYTVTQTAAQAIDLFRPDTPDPELHELPNVCSHFVIDTDGTIYGVVPLSIMCRHTVGLNDTAIGIEHAGMTAAEILGRSAQMRASLALTRSLQCRFGIPADDVIGHNESLGSSYHHERVAALRTQTHQDWTAAEMSIYRRRLKRRSGC